MKKGGIIAVFIIVILGAFVVYTTKDVIDRFNPFISEEYVYVEVNKPAEPDNGRYKYKLTGYNANGQKKNVVFTTSVELPKGTYLKVLAKGSFTEKYEKVGKDIVPNNLLIE